MTSFYHRPLFRFRSTGWEESGPGFDQLRPRKLLSRRVTTSASLTQRFPINWRRQSFADHWRPPQPFSVFYEEKIVIRPELLCQLNPPVSDSGKTQVPPAFCFVHIRRTWIANGRALNESWKPTFPFQFHFQLISTQVAVIHMLAANQWPEKGDSCAKYFSARLWPSVETARKIRRFERSGCSFFRAAPRHGHLRVVWETGCSCNVVVV